MKVKFRETIKKQKATDYEKKIVEEMEKGTEKYFNNEGNLSTHKFLGMTEVLRREVVKELAEIHNERIYIFTTQ